MIPGAVTGASLADVLPAVPSVWPQSVSTIAGLNFQGGYGGLGTQGARSGLVMRLFQSHHIECALDFFAALRDVRCQDRFGAGGYALC